MPLGIDDLPSFMSTTNTHEAFYFSKPIKSPPLIMMKINYHKKMGTTNKPSATGINILETFMSTTNTHEGFLFFFISTTNTHELCYDYFQRLNVD